MRCKFCHNPETWDFGTKSANGTPNGSFEISAEDLLKKAVRYKPYWGTDGGITVSGGEPLAQIDFMIEFFEAAKAAGVHTCVDTSGVTFRPTGEPFAKFERLMKSTDLLLVDIKHIDADDSQATVTKTSSNFSVTSTASKSPSGSATCSCLALAITTKPSRAPAISSAH